MNMNLAPAASTVGVAAPSANAAARTGVLPLVRLAAAIGLPAAEQVIIAEQADGNAQPHSSVEHLVVFLTPSTCSAVVDSAAVVRLLHTHTCVAVCADARGFKFADAPPAHDVLTAASDAALSAVQLADSVLTSVMHCTTAAPAVARAHCVPVGRLLVATPDVLVRSTTDAASSPVLRCASLLRFLTGFWQPHATHASVQAASPNASAAWSSWAAQVAASGQLEAVSSGALGGGPLDVSGAASQSLRKLVMACVPPTASSSTITQPPLCTASVSASGIVLPLLLGKFWVKGAAATAPAILDAAMVAAFPLVHARLERRVATPSTRAQAALSAALAVCLELAGAFNVGRDEVAASTSATPAGGDI
ncbi:MAG: hypothetical protein EOO41_04840, partial [Methanobacteriota archaeon]